MTGERENEWKRKKKPLGSVPIRNDRVEHIPLRCAVGGYEFRRGKREPFFDREFFRNERAAVEMDQDRDRMVFFRELRNEFPDLRFKSSLPVVLRYVSVLRVCETGRQCTFDPGRGPVSFFIFSAQKFPVFSGRYV